MRKRFSLMLILVLLLSGCDIRQQIEETMETQMQETTAAPAEISFHTKEIQYSEPLAQYGFRLNMDCTETAYAKYYFEPVISYEERYACIEATDVVFAKQEIIDPLSEIYVFTEKKYAETNIIENQLFLSVQDWRAVEYTANLLLTAYGPDSHYGLAYGYAAFLCGLSLPNVPSVIPTVTDVLDLNLLCFDPEFVTKSDLEAAKWYATDFVRTYISDNGEEALQKLLSESDTENGAETVIHSLKQYYERMGIYYVPSNLCFRYGGHSFDYILSSNLAAFYVRNDWEDFTAQSNPLIYEGFLHQNYSDTKAFFQINLTQMQQYQALFALDNYRNDLSVIFENSNLSQYSFYQSSHRIYVKNVDSLMHEYIHALTQPQSSMKLWEVEGFARYFSYRYDYYGIAFLNQDYNTAPITSKTSYVHEYLNKIQRPIDMAMDYEDLENIAVWCFDFWDPNENYVAASSFVQFLVNQYGEEAVIASLYGNKDPLPATYAEQVRAWKEHIESCYQEYSKYEKKTSSSTLKNEPVT